MNRRRRRSLHGALLAARTAGHSHVQLDGTLLNTDRSRALGPTVGVDLCWSDKHHHHGGNVQLVTAPDGWPLWTSEVFPGREHDTTRTCAHPDLLPTLDAWTELDHATLAAAWLGQLAEPQGAPGCRQHEELGLARHGVGDGLQLGQRRRA